MQKKYLKKAKKYWKNVEEAVKKKLSRYWYV